MKNVSLILICLISINVFSQVQVSTNSTINHPSYLINNILIGNGVTTSNHNFTGDSSQIGYFTDSTHSIGFSEGFILSTGNIDSIGNTGADTIWWNHIYDSTWTNIIDSTPIVEGYHLSTSFMGAGDPDLLTIANSVPGLIGQTFTVSSTEDAAILEFDFVPSSDTVTFNYVFASEEYLDFVNSSYNDVFAFLISGPGITGPYNSPPSFPGGAINIAEVPNSVPSLPITISTVNDTINSQYYNYDTLAIASAFNGFTDVFTAKAAVIPCNIYHIKLAIADGTDDSFDSGVFFEAGSFDATEPGALNINTVTSDILCYGDTTGNVQLCIAGGVAPYTTNWFGVNPNNLAAGTYNVSVTDVQGSSGSTTYTINEPLQLIITSTYSGNQLEGYANGGTPAYTYEWFLNGITVSTSDIFTPSQNGDYTLTVTDANGCTTTSDPINVNNISTSVSSLLTNKLMIFPNPFKTATTINLLDNSKLTRISLYDPQGRKVREFNHHIGSDKIIIEKGSLQNGVYLLIIETNNYISKSKLILE